MTESSSQGTVRNFLDKYLIDLKLINDNSMVLS